jgi:uncharacterized membrane protein
MTTTKMLLAEIAGWYGAAAILLAYFLVSFDLLSSGSAAFQWLNLTGAIGLILIAAAKNVKQGVVLNGVWAAVSVVALVKMMID